MKVLFEALKIILPAIISGIFTFIITKYTYNRNKPLDKLETAYNKVYYPLYKLIRNIDYSNDIGILINKSKRYFKIYDKYIDQSSINAFKYLCNCHIKEQKIAYQNFKDNIYDRSAYLRRRLGYLEPNTLKIYKYLPPSDKSTVRILIEIMMFILLFTAFGLIINYFEIDQQITEYFVCSLIVFLGVIIGEIIIKNSKKLFYKFKAQKYK